MGNIYNNNWSNTSEEVCKAEGSRKSEVQEFTYRDTRIMEHEMCGYTGNNWSHRNSNERFKE